MLKKAAIVATLATAGVLATGTGAFAASSPTYSKSTTGASASCSFYTWTVVAPNDHAQISCSLKDTSADGHSVYVEWWQDGFGHVTITNSGGNGTTKNFTDARVDGAGAFETLYFKVCRDVQLSPDNCSSTQSWKV